MTIHVSVVLIMNGYPCMLPLYRIDGGYVLVVIEDVPRIVFFYLLVSNLCYKVHFTSFLFLCIFYNRYNNRLESFPIGT